MKQPVSPPWRQLLVLLILALPISAAAADGFRVIATIKPIHSLLAGLMLDIAPPELLIDGQQTPLDYHPGKEDLARLRQADLVIWVGPELEPGLADVIKTLPARVKTVELLSSPDLKILPSRSDDSLRDPYFWLDDRNMLILLDDLTHLLQDMDAARAHVYARNREHLLKRLSKLDREYEYGYRGMKAGLGVEYQDTLQYFEQAYALKILARVAPLPPRPAETKALFKAREFLQHGEANCVLTEKGLPAPNLGLLTQGVQANRGELDSLGLGLTPGPDLYFRLMDHNTETIKRCIGADMDEAARAKQQADQLAAAADGPFLLVDHLGRPVTRESMSGKYQLLYFGYTFCPDICPTSLSVMTHALRLLGDKAKLIQPYFITIDPERDTREVLRGYVGYFDKRLIGVTGRKDMLDRLAARYKVRYEKVTEDTGDPDLYLMDHTANLYLISPQGRLLKTFLHGITAQQLRDELIKILEKG